MFYVYGDYIPMKTSTMVLALISLIVVVPTPTLCKKSKKAPKVEIVKSHTHVSESPKFRKFSSLFIDFGSKENSGKKMVCYLYTHTTPWPYDHVLSPEDAALYKKNNIIVKKDDCELGVKEKHWISKALLIPLIPLLLVGMRINGLTDLYFSLLSDAGKKIDIYESMPVLSDSRFYSTPHKNRIAVLIDENGYIVSILDNVKSEDDIFKAFNIK